MDHHLKPLSLGANERHNLQPNSPILPRKSVEILGTPSSQRLHNIIHPILLAARSRDFQRGEESRVVIRQTVTQQILDSLLCAELDVCDFAV